MKKTWKFTDEEIRAIHLALVFFINNQKKHEAQVNCDIKSYGFEKSQFSETIQDLHDRIACAVDVMQDD